MGWVFLILAGCFEVAGVVGLNKLAEKFTIKILALVVAGFICSFSLLSLAMQSLPLGISYAVWTGIGTVGGVLIGMSFFGESRDFRRILCIAAIIVAIVGLRLFG